jgi:hypothetical protein
MKVTKLLLLCLCCIMGASAVWGQTENSPSKAGILGYLDPKTGAFRPIPQASDDAIEPAALTVTGGTITVTLTITVKSVGLTTFSCSAETNVPDNSASLTAFRNYLETATVAATGTGATRTCKVTIPYSWSLTTPASDSMTTGYTVFATGTAPSLTQRTSTLSNLDTRKVPANGATTALTAAVTI